jgi:Tfp pilus assembly PilM family ATPase
VGLSIEIRNNEVVFVEARLSKSRTVIRKSGTFQFNETYIDQFGVTDPENFALILSQKLAEAKIKERSCNLCLNNTSIIYREIFVPKVDEKRFPFLVRSEMMSALHLTPDYIMDYISLDEVERNGNYMYRVLGVAVTEGAIKSYINAFKKAKLKINIIDSATNAVIKMMHYSSMIETSHQFIVAEIHEGNLRLYLFDDGDYILTRNSRIRAKADDEKEAFLTEVSDSISKMLQFSFTRNSKGISNILYIGDDKILDDVNGYVFETLSLEGERFSSAVSGLEWTHFKDNYTNAVGVLLRK